MELHLNPLMFKVIGIISFKLNSPLNIGLGGEGSRREFLRVIDGRLLIPASTWKGSFRHLTELIAKSTTFNGVADLAVKLYKETKAGITYNAEIKKFEEFASGFQKSLKDANIRNILLDIGYSDEDIIEAQKDTDVGRLRLLEMAEAYIAIHCPIGKLYGNRVLAGKIRFLDTLIKQDDKEIKMHVKPGIGIDRQSGKVREGALYFIDTISPKPEIKLKLIADNLIPKEDDSKLFASTLELVRFTGLSIGARKSTGMGHLNLENASFYIIDLRKDENLAIGNPFKKAQSIDLEGFLKWLRG
ncbi:MAG: RAMP superfamily CRISPR-associated protein [Nitrososphaeria archaeon]|nr:RAMP superfamily CRISPR-associated protein [Nitrososphaeria archaeon]